MCGEISAAAAATYFDDISRHHLQFGLLSGLGYTLCCCTTHAMALHCIICPISVTFQCVGGSWWPSQCWPAAGSKDHRPLPLPYFDTGHFE